MQVSRRATRRQVEWAGAGGLQARVLAGSVTAQGADGKAGGTLHGRAPCGVGGWRLVTSTTEQLLEQTTRRLLGFDFRNNTLKESLAVNRGCVFIVKLDARTGSKA